MSEYRYKAYKCRDEVTSDLEDCSRDLIFNLIRLYFYSEEPKRIREGYYSYPDAFHHVWKTVHEVSKVSETSNFPNKAFIVDTLFMQNKKYIHYWMDMILEEQSHRLGSITGTDRQNCMRFMELYIEELASHLTECGIWLQNSCYKRLYDLWKNYR